MSSTGAIDQTTPVRQRIISETTGLVKFNITKKKIEERTSENAKFVKLEAEMNRKSAPTPPKRPLTSMAVKPAIVPYSPSRRDKNNTAVNETRNNNVAAPINKDLMLELAEKQREVLEFKENMETLKFKLANAERELREIERKCNTNIKIQHTEKGTPQPNLSSKPSLQSFRASLNMNNTNSNISPPKAINYDTLKRKISLPQLSKLKDRNSPFNQTLNENIQRFQKESNIILERGLTFVNNLRNDMFREEHASDFELSSEEEAGEEGETSYLSDYGDADASDYMLAVK